jgi:hypothetical protein
MKPMLLGNGIIVHTVGDWEIEYVVSSQMPAHTHTQSHTRLHVSLLHEWMDVCRCTIGMDVDVTGGCCLLYLYSDSYSDLGILCG